MIYLSKDFVAFNLVIIVDFLIYSYFIYTILIN